MPQQIWLCHVHQKVRQCFTISPMSVSNFSQYINSHASSLVFYITMWFRCSCFTASSCSTASILLLLLPPITMMSMIAISCLNAQHGCSFFCTSTLLSSQPCSVSSDSEPMCSSSSTANLIPSATTQSGMSMHYYIVLVVRPMLGIS